MDERRRKRLSPQESGALGSALPLFEDGFVEEKSMSDVKIKGRVLRDRAEDLFIVFRPKAQVPVASVCLPRSAIAVVQEPVTVTVPLKMAEEKGIDEYAR